MISEQENSEFVEESTIGDTSVSNPVENVDNLENETSTESQESNYSEVEKAAMVRGWKPKEQFYGEEDTFVSAKEFLDRGNLYERISQQNHIIKKLERKLDEVANLNSKQIESQIQDKASYYVQLRREAIRNGDVEEVERIENEYQKLYSQPQNHYSYQKTPIDPYVEEFQHRNANWYNSDTEENLRMMSFANVRDAKLAELYPDWDVQRRHREVEEAVKRAYPNRFTNVYRNMPTTVNITNRENVPRKRNSKTFGFNDLPSDWKAFVENRCEFYQVKDKDQYARELYEMGELR